MQIAVYSNFFQGFWVAGVLPFTCGIFLALKRALWASAFNDL